MDLYNNELGRKIATESPRVNKEELAQLVVEVIESGQAIVIGSDHKITFSDQVEVGATKRAHKDQINDDVTTRAPTWQTNSD